MTLVIQELRDIYRRIDRLIEETGGLLSNVIGVRGGYKRRYITYYVNISALPIQGNFKVKVHDEYIDYISDPNGDYITQRRGGSRYIRFPIPYQGPVLIVLTNYGFRVYLLK